MFTGLVKTRGMIVDVLPLSGGIKLCIISRLKLKVGNSISCSGVCLTVVTANKYYFEVEVWGESLCLSGLVELQRFDMVNLEEPITLNTPLHGNITNGYSKSVVTIDRTYVYGDSIILVVKCPKWISEEITSPSSISLDGVALTITRSGEGYFEVLLTRYTILNTMFRYFDTKRWFNLEQDVMQRWCLKM
ncbi:Riboflavin synthase alpha chain [Candidatus Hodgkinia cicadicola]|uniref:Riboflavin synthase n=1 Tax=Candidatus Hodgkinia cicadicola TaxID=573658 RepID=A0ABX4MF69_9HYPH|nr:Riboflavin synthase alpha chain [Candidatus Hodgkinia cicadicola]PIM95363.1 Riboflavin synthase alpha chain [Candidatus Hodgkinia cicadicola]PIM95651.1 Riboflavin synthase alpha chain [Candidatus Hodgkinia cicadicola]